MKKLFLLAFALVSAQALGQAYSGSVVENSPGNYGRPVPYPQIVVCNSSDTAVPCTQKAATFTDDTLTTLCTTSGTSGQLIGNPSSGPGCNNPGIGDVNGNFTVYVQSGEYMLCSYSGTWLCQKFTLGTGGGIAATQCAGAINGAMGAWISPQSLGCDNNITTDFAGHLTVQTETAVAPYDGLLNMQTNANGDASFPPLGVDWEAPNVTPPTPYRIRVPNAIPSVGQLPQVSAIQTNTNGANGTHAVWNWVNGTITINGTSCALGGSCSLAASPISLTATSPVVVTPSPITGTGIISCPTCQTSAAIHGISFYLYNSTGLASGTTTASTSYLTIPFGCTLQAYNLAIDQGTITVKFWKVATGTAIPTSGNSINTSGVSISSGTAIHSTTLTDFTTTTVTANDIMAMNITAVSGGPTFVNGVLQCQ